MSELNTISYNFSLAATNMLLTLLHMLSIYPYLLVDNVAREYQPIKRSRETIVEEQDDYLNEESIVVVGEWWTKFVRGIEKTSQIVKTSSKSHYINIIMHNYWDWVKSTKN